MDRWRCSEGVVIPIPPYHVVDIGEVAGLLYADVLCGLRGKYATMAVKR